MQAVPQIPSDRLHVPRLYPAEIEAFLADQIGGRYQEEMPEDVAKRLEELRVNVKEITYEPADEK